MEWTTPKAVPPVSRVSRLESATPSIDLTRKQIETELQVMRLKDEVERLGGVCRESPGKWTESGVLEEENSELKKSLSQTEGRFVELQKEYSTLSSRVEREAIIFGAQLKDLNDKNELLKAEKSRLKSQYGKASKSISTLKSYLEGVPSLEELNEVKASLGIKEALIREVLSKLDTKNLALEQMQARLSASEKKLSEACCEQEEAKMRLNVAEDKLQSNHMRLQDSQKINPTDTEVLMEKSASLKIENDELKRYIQYMKSKHKKELAERDARLLEEGTRIQRMGEELLAVNEQSVKYRESLDLLRGSLKESEKKREAGIKRIVALEGELSHSEGSQVRDEEVGRLLSRLTADLCTCLRDIEGLSLLSQQVVSGEDPNLSQLLGFDRSPSHTKQEESSEGEEDKLHTLQGLLVQVKRIKKDIADMRRTLADNYAETLGTNMTSCITQ